MATIKIYEPTDKELRPTDAGYSAFEQEARRINPLFREIGQNQVEIGRLQNQANEERKWPFDFLDLVAARSRGGGGGSSGGVRVRAGVDNPFGFGNQHMVAGVGALGAYLGDAYGSGSATGTGKAQLYPMTGGPQIVDTANPVTDPRRLIDVGSLFPPDGYGGGSDNPEADAEAGHYGGGSDPGIGSAISGAAGGIATSIWGGLENFLSNTGGGPTSGGSDFGASYDDSGAGVQ